MSKQPIQERVLSALLTEPGLQKAGANKHLGCKSVTKELDKLKTNYGLRIQAKFVNNQGRLSECYVIKDRITAKRVMRKMRSKHPH